jgi:aryl-alcohol dehydrogenase-like predicted oxidoreductase
MNYEWPASPTTPITRAFPARHVIECVEKSLRNLGVEALQVEQLHVWHDIWMESHEWHETRGVMERLKREGKVLHWGVSINDHAPETALRADRDPLIETAQVIYNVYDRSRANPQLARRRRVIVRVPFDEGGCRRDGRTGLPEGTSAHGTSAASAERGAARAEGSLGDEAATCPS